MVGILKLVLGLFPLTQSTKQSGNAGKLPQERGDPCDRTLLSAERFVVALPTWKTKKSYQCDVLNDFILHKKIKNETRVYVRRLMEKRPHGQGGSSWTAIEEEDKRRRPFCCGCKEQVRRGSTRYPHQKSIIQRAR